MTNQISKSLTLAMWTHLISLLPMKPTKCSWENCYADNIICDGGKAK